MKRKWYKKGKELLTEIANTQVNDSKVAIWYIGQCGFVIKKDKIIYIDPVLADIAGEDGVSQRLYEPPYKPEEAYADYVICTHKHRDHMQEETVCGMYKHNINLKFIVPGICKKVLIQWGIPKENIIEAKQKKLIEIDEYKILPISTAHPTHKTEDDGTEWDLAYDIEVDKTHIIHLGDTYLTEQLRDDLLALNSPDIFMVPINGSDYYREVKNIVGNMSVKEAAMLACEINADMTIPMHYDMIEGNTENPLRFVEELWNCNASKRIRLPALGEIII